MHPTHHAWGLGWHPMSNIVPSTHHSTQFEMCCNSVSVPVVTSGLLYVPRKYWLNQWMSEWMSELMVTGWQYLPSYVCWAISHIVDRLIVVQPLPHLVSLGTKSTVWKMAEVAKSPAHLSERSQLLRGSQLTRTEVSVVVTSSRWLPWPPNWVSRQSRF